MAGRRNSRKFSEGLMMWKDTVTRIGFCRPGRDKEHAYAQSAVMGLLEFIDRFRYESQAPEVFTYCLGRLDLLMSLFTRQFGNFLAGAETHAAGSEARQTFLYNYGHMVKHLHDALALTLSRVPRPLKTDQWGNALVSQERLDQLLAQLVPFLAEGYQRKLTAKPKDPFEHMFLPFGRRTSLYPGVKRTVHCVDDEDDFEFDDEDDPKYYLDHYGQLVDLVRELASPNNGYAPSKLESRVRINKWSRDFQLYLAKLSYYDQDDMGFKLDDDEVDANDTYDRSQDKPVAWVTVLAAIIRLVNKTIREHQLNDRAAAPNEEQIVLLKCFAYWFKGITEALKFDDKNEKNEASEMERSLGGNVFLELNKGLDLFPEGFVNDRFKGEFVSFGVGLIGLSKVLLKRFGGDYIRQCFADLETASTSADDDETDSSDGVPPLLKWLAKEEKKNQKPQDAKAQ